MVTSLFGVGSPLYDIATKIYNAGISTARELTNLLVSQGFNAKEDVITDRAQIQIQRAMNAVRLSREDPQSWVPHELYVRIPKNEEITSRYRVTFRAELQDMTTGETSYRYYTQTRNNMQSISQMENQAFDIASSDYTSAPADYETENLTLRSMSIFSAMKYKFAHFNDVPDDFED